VPRLFMLTVPGLKVPTDWAAVCGRLPADFPEGDANVDAWLEAISDGILSRRTGAENALRVRTQSRARDHQRVWGLRGHTAVPPDPRDPYQLNH
jgi:hypothetical protein